MVCRPANGPKTAILASNNRFFTTLDPLLADLSVINAVLLFHQTFQSPYAMVTHNHHTADSLPAGKTPQKRLFALEYLI